MEEETTDCPLSSDLIITFQRKEKLPRNFSNYFRQAFFGEKFKNLQFVKIPYPFGSRVGSYLWISGTIVVKSVHDFPPDWNFDSFAKWRIVNKASVSTFQISLQIQTSPRILPKII